MNLDNFKKNYLISSLYFNNSENILEDDCNNVWTMDYEYEGISPGSGKDNISLITTYKNEYIDSSIQIPKPNANISMVNEIFLGGKSFTIDFWMFFHTDVSTSTSYGFSNEAMFLIQWPDKSLKLYPDELTVNSSITGYIKKDIPNNYFTNEAYNIISTNNDSMFHLIISYNTEYSINHPDKKNVINFYINYTDIVDHTQYKEVLINRNKVLVMLINKTWNYPMVISNFRIWDGIAIELSNEKFLLSDGKSYLDLDFPLSDNMITTIYDNMVKLKG